MQFLDEVTIDVIAGKGGDGCTSFLRQRNRPKGGPDGGNGGHGGNVELYVQSGLNTLVDYRVKQIYKAKNGRHGEGNQKTGANGQSIRLPMPAGIKITDAQTGKLVGELLTEKDSICVAKGGQPGIGNMHFASSVNQVPYHHTSGKPGEKRQLHIELQLLADVGLVGKPNAGKSSLIRKLSAATPKVADYPFTTLTPQLGLVRGYGNEFVIADIPGLIEGSKDGRGLGNRFLRHINRTHLLWHVIDCMPLDSDPVEDFLMLRKELQQAKQLQDQKEKDSWIILNKIDLLDNSQLAELQKKFAALVDGSSPIYTISALSGAGCERLRNDALQWITQRQMEKQT